MKKNTKTFLIFLSVILLAIINIILSVIYRGNSGANIFTAISGWISGVATIILGLMAFYQSKKYKIENDRTIEAQKLLINKIKQENEKSNEISYRLYEANVLEKYEDALENFYRYLFEKAHCTDIKSTIDNFILNKQSSDGNGFADLKRVNNDLRVMSISLTFIHYKNFKRDELIKNIMVYNNYIDELIKFKNKPIYIPSINDILNKLESKFYDILTNINQYKLFLINLHDKVMNYDIDFNDIKDELSSYNNFKLAIVEGKRV